MAGNTYELAILDLGLPGLDGGEVLRRLRARQQKTPVLVLSARLAVEERVRVLDLGADDYVVKPVRLDELEARVRALIRRGQGTAVPDLMLGRLRLDTIGKRAWLDDKALDLNAREWAALAFLTSQILWVITSIWHLLSFSFYGLSKLFVKAGEAAWKGFVPFYNFYVLSKLLNKPWWWCLIMVVPGVNLMMFGVYGFNVARAFNKAETKDLVFASIMPYLFFVVAGH